MTRFMTLEKSRQVSMEKIAFAQGCSNGEVVSLAVPICPDADPRRGVRYLLLVSLLVLAVPPHVHLSTFEIPWQRPALRRVTPLQIRQFPGKELSGKTQKFRCDLLFPMRYRPGTIIDSLFTTLERMLQP